VNGAERLRGHGDMLYYDGRTYPIRGQGSLVTSAEIQKVLNYLKDQLTPSYSFEPAEENEQEVSGQRAADDILEDDKFEAALRLVLERQEASVSIIQRNFGVGWSRAGRLMDMMYRLGIVGPYEGSKPRQILVDPAEYLALLAQGGIEALRKRKPDKEPKPQLPLDEGEPDDATSEEE
jgi:S-DNA-T family DNA segregation ATPase FtsK/SpoIIIE